MLSGCLTGAFRGQRERILWNMSAAIEKGTTPAVRKGTTWCTWRGVECRFCEKGWKALYYAEEFAKDNGVPIIVLQKSGVVENES